MEKIHQITHLGTMGGATTFALAKVKNALGRIGIFSNLILEGYSLTHYHLDCDFCLRDCVQSSMSKKKEIVDQLKNVILIKRQKESIRDIE